MGGVIGLHFCATTAATAMFDRKGENPALADVEDVLYRWP